MPRLPLACPVVAVLLAGPAAAEPPKFSAEQVAFYEKLVRPLLQKHCFKCHGTDEKKIKGGLSLATRSSILAGGDIGPAANPDKPDDSLLLKAITNKRPDGGDVMPPAGKLPDAEIAVLTKWVRAGLPVTADALGEETRVQEHKGGITEEAKRYWAYQPVKRPELPGQTANPIDAFLNAKLAAKGLTPNGPAAKAVLVRRAYYDLLGLPPTPEQVDAFVNDPSPEAWPRLIDQLLASPHYGEKWGRHWLDVVRFAETNGYERDGPKPFAWRYRDYVIRSFNADKPYDQFLREQLAGDELPNPSADAITATGFLRLGLWDDEPADAEMALFDGYDDYVSTVGQGMLAMTLNCARCHDHKKDPILHADYYRFVAFFRDVRPFSDTRDTRSKNNLSDITPIERRSKYEGELTARNARIEALTAEMEKVEDAAIKRLPAEDQRAAEGLDRPQVVAKLKDVFTPAEQQEYTKRRRERDELKKKPLPSQELALSVNNCLKSPPPTHVLARGNPYAKKEAVTAGFPTVLGGGEAAVKPAAKSSGRRTALADWIASKQNPLTARVMVNRVWQHHFGKGIVPTPNDFGKLGEPPSHPELLDWLASEFTATGWRLKPLHKLLMTSAAYQRASTATDKGLSVDPANALLWRFNMRRLAAEEVRDSMLAVSGRLKTEQYGPSVYPKIPKEVLAGQSVPGQGWVKSLGGGYDPADPTAGDRRTVYVYVKRSLQVPVLAAHDQADTDSSCPVRYTTTVPTQALGMLNGEFAHEQATALAARLTKEHPGDVAKQVVRAVRLTTGRTPSADELAADAAFVARLRAEHNLDAATALARYTLLALNANEFVYLD